MTTYPFIVQVEHRRYVQAPKVLVRWREQRRVTGTVGPFTTVERSGWDKTAITVAPHAVGQVGIAGRVPAREATGHQMSSSHRAFVPATAAGLKKAVRRVRPQEAGLIAAIDDEIADLEARIRDLRDERRHAVAVAWTNGHAVRLNEAVPQGDGDGALRWLEA